MSQHYGKQALKILFSEYEGCPSKSWTFVITQDIYVIYILAKSSNRPPAFH